MANESTVDQQQLQSTIDELYRKLSELFPAQRDALRNALNTIQVGENQTLGMLAAADDLATAPVGDQAVLMEAIGLGVLSGALNAVDLAAFRTAIGLGSLATLSSLSDADVGDAAVVRQALELGVAATGDAATVRHALELGSAAQQPDSRYPKLSGGANANFSEMPLVAGSQIVEQGYSDPNGNYIRYSNGVQECWRDVMVATYDEYLVAFGWTYPASFRAAQRPTVIAQPIDYRDTNGAGTASSSNRPNYTRNRDNTSCTIYIDRDREGNNPPVGSTSVICIRAIGRWK